MNGNTQLLDVLTREGVLISVSVRYWRATRKLNAEDLGLNPDNVTDRLISLGHKKLLPREALERFALIESRAHSLINASAFGPFTRNPRVPGALRGHACGLAGFSPQPQRRSLCLRPA